MRVVLLHQFLFLENIVDMLPYSLLVTVKQRGHLVSTEPYRLVLQLHIKLYAPVLRAVYLYGILFFLHGFFFNYMCIVILQIFTQSPTYAVRLRARNEAFTI